MPTHRTRPTTIVVPAKAGTSTAPPSPRRSGLRAGTQGGGVGLKGVSRGGKPPLSKGGQAALGDVPPVLKKPPRVGGWAQPRSQEQDYPYHASTGSRPAWSLFHTPLFRPCPLSGGCSAVVPIGTRLLPAPRGSNPRLRNNPQPATPPRSPDEKTSPSCAPSPRGTTAHQPQTCFGPPPSDPRHGGAEKKRAKRNDSTRMGKPPGSAPPTLPPSPLLPPRASGSPRGVP